MCFAQPVPEDKSAKIARQQEQARKAAITTGQGRIDDAFQFFDDDYFSGFQNDYLNFYNPQVDKQFTDTRQKLKYDLARKGTLNSTPGQTKFGDLITDYTDRRNEVSSNALAKTAQLRGDVESNKAQLYQQNTTAADPSLAAQSAASSVNALSTPPVYSPLADLFGGFINSYATNYAANQQKLPAGYAQLFNPGSSSGSTGKVIT